MSPAKIKKLFLIIYGLSIFSAFFGVFFYWLLGFSGLIAIFAVLTAGFLLGWIDKESDDVFNKTPPANKNPYLKVSKKIRHAEVDFFTDAKADKILLSLIKTIDWSLFEDLCLDYIKSQNCEANKTAHGADGGIDIEFFYNKGKKGIVQCKRFSKADVGVQLVRELYGVMMAQKADKAVFITSSDFTKDARDFAETVKNFHIISGAELVDKLNKAPDELIQNILVKISSKDCLIPTCSQCNIKMVQRKAKKSGRLFWGCKNYPQCHSKINIRQS